MDTQDISDGPVVCTTCGENYTEVLCPECEGECMTWHDCGEDICVCVDPENNEYCETCMGEGTIIACPECVVYYWC